MPSSTSTNASSRASSSSNIARKSTKPSRAMPQVIEIDDSSDDGQDVPRPLFRPPTRPPISFTAVGRSAPWPSTSNSSTSTAAGSNHNRQPLTGPQRDTHFANRRIVAPMSDSSATEHTSDSGVEQQRQANERHTRARDSAPDRPVRSRGEGASASISRAPAASTSRDKVTITSNNNRPRTASWSNRPNPRDKASRRDASTSATEDSSADEAPVVATSSARRPRPVGTEIVNMARGQAAAASIRAGPSASRRNSVTSLSRTSTAGDTSTNLSARDQQRQKARETIRRRQRTDVEILEGSDDSDSDDESTTDSSAVTVASSARTAMVRPTRTIARKRALEPEVTVTTTKRSRSSNTAADTSAGPSVIATREKRGAGLSRTGSTASIKDAGTKTDAKGKGRAPRSSIEPASVTKATSSSRVYNSGVSMPSFLDNALFPQGKDDTLVSPRADIYSESTKINYPNVSKVITKVVIKPTDLSEELECAICSDIMVSPVNLICGHTFCEACVTPWLDTNKDCPSCRTKMDTAPVRSYLADRVIKKYLETIYTSLEAEGKLKEAKAARAERATAEKDAEKRRMKAAADKNRRAAAEARFAAARGQAGYGLAFPARANRPPGGIGLQEWIAQMQNHHDIGGAGAGGALGNAAAAAVPPPAPPANARQAARRGARAAQAAAAEAAAAQAAAQGNAGAGHVVGGGGAAAGGAAQNNADQFGGLLQNRGGALHVDPARLQQTADEMGVPAAQLFQIMFQG